jgi:hypothetical protein
MVREVSLKEIEKPGEKGDLHASKDNRPKIAEIYAYDECHYTMDYPSIFAYLDMVEQPVKQTQYG